MVDMLVCFVPTLLLHSGYVKRIMLPKCVQIRLISGIYHRSLHGTVSIKRFASQQLTEDLVRERFFNERVQFSQELEHLKVDVLEHAVEVRASVLVPVCIVGDHLSILYTIRTSRVTSHKGQVSFPGGMIEQSDESVIEAAKRETEEELGIDRNNIEVWNTLSHVPEQSMKYSVLPVLGYIGQLDIEELCIDKHEVDQVFALSILHLLNPQNQGYTRFKFGAQMPVLFNSYRTIWGLTAITTDTILTAAFPDHHKRLFSIFNPATFKDLLSGKSPAHYSWYV